MKVRVESALLDDRDLEVREASLSASSLEGRGVRLGESKQVYPSC